MRKAFAVLLLVVTKSLPAQQPSAFHFSIKNIMRGPELYGRQPGNIHWSADSKWIYFTWLEPGTDWRETPKQFRVRAIPGSKPERVSIQQVDSTGSRFARGGDLPPNPRSPPLRVNGRLYLNDLSSRSTPPLTPTTQPQRAPKISADHRQIRFLR